MNSLGTGNEEPEFINLESISEGTSKSYNAFIRQQQNRRQADRRNRVQTVSVDHRKRINDPMLSQNNNSGVAYVHESYSEGSTSNEESTNIFDYELCESFNLLNIPTTAYVLPTCTYCKYCGAKKFHRETKGFCCCDGKVKLFMPDSPNELYDLFISKEPTCMEFKKLSRGYNNHFAFTSFGVKYDKELFKSYRGIYTFRVQGQIYHYVNQLMPQNNMPHYMQLYFYDTDNEIQNRIKISENLVEPTLTLLIEILKGNPYSKFFRSLSNITNLHDHRIQIKCHHGLDQRVFNTPSASQVAAVWVDDDENANNHVRDITIYGHSGDSHKVHYYYGCYDPLQYPLLFPFGESGWHEGIQRYKHTSSQPENLADHVAVPKIINSAVQMIEKEDEGLLIYFVIYFLILKISMF
jgi:hypothetical protein